MKIKIKVTKDVLLRSSLCGFYADKRISENCAVAVAVRDILPAARVTNVYIHPFGWGTSGDWDTGNLIDLPVEIRQFIQKFDRLTPKKRRKIDPFDFEVDLPDAVIDIIGISQAEDIIKRSETLELI